MYLCKDPADSCKFMIIRFVQRVAVFEVDLPEESVQESYDHSEEDKAQEFADALNADVVMVKEGLPSLRSLAPIHVNALTESAERWAKENGVTGVNTSGALL